jgi:hypothetical protein
MESPGFSSDKNSPAIPIGPQWMILWPFNAKAAGLPSTVQDAGAWVMFDGTPYAHRMSAVRHGAEMSTYREKQVRCGQWVTPEKATFELFGYLLAICFSSGSKAMTPISSRFLPNF